MLSRMIDSRDVARGIAYYETSWYLAGTIGSKIGGDLSNPVEQFPQLFGSIKFFKDYPYFLPCATCSILLLTGWLVAAALLRDTKDECVTEDGIKSTMRPLLLREYFAPGIIIAAVNYSSVCLIQMFRSSTEVLYLSTPIGDGGLGFSPSAIGTLASICAIATGLSHLFVFPRVHNKLGWRNIFVLGLIASVPLFVLWPVMNWIARKDGYSGWVWFALGVQILCYILNEFAWIAISVFIAQSYGGRAAVMGFCEMVAGILAAVAPTVSNSLFSLSIDKGYLGGYMVYFVFVCIVVLALCASSLLPRDSKSRENRPIEMRLST
ncbi:hypothetical protein AX14_001153 [Amanita brunnescens Koide BX004]|nr:hypothetical protein AX14_001153 [Amanita brunnescens Koide BX004]